MSGFAPLLAALVLAQGEPSPAAADKPPTAAPAEREGAGREPAAKEGPERPPTSPAATAPATAIPNPTAPPTTTSTATSTPTPPATTSTAPPAPAAPPTPTSTRIRTRTTTATPAPTSTAPPGTANRKTSTATPTTAAAAATAATSSSSRPPPPPPAHGRAPDADAPERDQAARAARAFLEALAAADADRLAQASSERFSFDGETQSGRDAVRRTWRALLAGRPGPAPRVSGLEVLPAAEAIARLGKPPARLAPLARAGVWVAIGDVGGRPVVLFLAREGGRIAVLGMHD